MSKGSRNDDSRQKAASTPDGETPDGAAGDRRAFLKTSFAGFAAGAGLAAAPARGDAAIAAPHNGRGGPTRTLITGGVVLSMDPAVGDFLKGDILIDGGRIVAVGPAIKESRATVVDASDMIVIPGLVDAHRHCWQNMFRLMLPNADGVAYGNFATQLIPSMRPQDVYIGTLLSGLTAIDSGVTCLIDVAHISKTAEHTEAGITAHLKSGIRGVYVYAAPRNTTAPQFPGDIHRIKAKFFSSSDQLVSLRLYAGFDADNFALARSVGVGMTIDGVFGVATPQRPVTANAQILEFAGKGLLGPDLTLIHGTGFPDEVMQAVVSNGVNLVLAPTSEGTLRGLGDSTALIQKAIDFKHLDRTGLSVDVEVCLSTDLFAQMRAVYQLQRIQSNRLWAAGDPKAPAMMTVRDVLKIATVGGAAAAGLSDRIGTLTPGKQADIVLIRANDISTGPLNNAYGTVVTGATSGNVDTVFIGGEIRKWKGKLVGAGEASVLREARRSRDHLAAAAKLWKPEDILHDKPAAYA
jgi:cytosine/adenosine deaminase-related metal-dependent hydrolase